MLEDNIKIKEQKVFKKIFLILLIIGVVLIIVVDRKAIFKILIWSTLFQGDFWPAVTYGTLGYTLENVHAYPPFMNLLYMLFGKFLGAENEKIWWRPIVAILYNFIPIVLTYKIIRKKFVNYKPIFALMLSLPGAYFTALRSCNSAYIFNVFTLFFILYYNSEDKTKREISILSLAIAISTRLVPAVFGFLLIVDKRYKDIIKLVIYCAVLFFGSLIFTVSELSYIERIKIFIDSLLIYNRGGFNRLGKLNSIVLIYNTFKNPGYDEKMLCYFVYIISLILILNTIFSNDYFKKVLSLCFIFSINARTTYHSYVIFVIPLIIYFNEKETKINLIILIIYILAVFSPISYFFIKHNEFRLATHTIIMDILFNIVMFYLIFDFFKKIYYMIKQKKYVEQVNSF